MPGGCGSDRLSASTADCPATTAIGRPYPEERGEGGIWITRSCVASVDSDRVDPTQMHRRAEVMGSRRSYDWRPVDRSTVWGINPVDRIGHGAG